MFNFGFGDSTLGKIGNVAANYAANRTGVSNLIGGYESGQSLFGAQEKNPFAEHASPDESDNSGQDKLGEVENDSIPRYTPSQAIVNSGHENFNEGNTNFNEGNTNLVGGSPWTDKTAGTSTPFATQPDTEAKQVPANTAAQKSQGIGQLIGLVLAAL